MKLPFAACLLAPALFAQPAMPSWLALYPGATPRNISYPALVATTYTTNDAPDKVAAHYRKLFEAQNLAFRPNPDGMGITVRASVPECDLLLTIRPLDQGATVAVLCAANKPLTVSAADPLPSRVIAGGQAAILERHSPHAAEMGLHKVYQDAAAPPLVWPDWLTRVEGGKIPVQPDVDPSGNKLLRARYESLIPMAEIPAFYKELLASHDYAVRTEGAIEGTNYPGGSPGPRTVISVRYSRAHPHDPVTVDLKFTTYAFHAPRQL